MVGDDKDMKQRIQAARSAAREHALVDVQRAIDARIAESAAEWAYSEALGAALLAEIEKAA